MRSPTLHHTTSSLQEAKTQLDEAHAKIDAAPSQIEDGKKQLNAAALQQDGMKQIADKREEARRLTGAD